MSDKRTFVLKAGWANGQGRIISDPNAVYRGEVTVAAARRSWCAPIDSQTQTLKRIASALEYHVMEDLYRNQGQ